MTTVLRLPSPHPQPQTPAKRLDLDLGEELPESKRPKLDDVDDEDMEEKSDHEGDDDPRLGYCIICGIMAEHRIDTCPNKSLGFGMTCLVCRAPCRSTNDEHKGKQVEMLKFCLVCGSQARHWSDDCPWNDPDKMYPKADPNVRSPWD